MMTYSEFEASYNEPLSPNIGFCVGNDCDQQPNVGWDYTKDGNAKIAFLFSQKNLDYLSNTITEALRGVDPEDRDIIIPQDKICNVLNSVYTNSTRPNVGDIHTRYIIESIDTRNDVKEINNQTIGIIVDYIKQEIEMTNYNKTLSIWDSYVLGDFNRQGIRAHPPIKIRKRTIQKMAFQMNY